MKNNFKNLDWKFYRRLFILTLPIVIQNLIASMLNMADTLMIGKLGEKELAAVGMANQYFFFFSLMLFGINAGVSMFISQFWGKKDVLSIKKMTSIGIVLGTVVSFIFMINSFPIDGSTFLTACGNMILIIAWK